MIVLVCVTVVAALTTFFVRVNLADARAALADKASNYGKLASKELPPVFDFDDRDAAREVFEELSVDPEVATVALYGDDGALVASSRPTSDDLAASTRRPGVRSVTPVLGKTKEGTVVVEMATAHLDLRRAEAGKTALAAGLAGVLLAFVVAWAGGRYLESRLGALVRNASRVAAGELDGLEPVRHRDDEIGDLSAALGTMADDLRALMGENERRTREIASRNRDMRLLLDHVAQGFLTVDGAGTIGSERSAVLERWFGPLPAQMTVAELIARADETAALWFQLGWESVAEGSLPLEVSLAQLPASIDCAGRALRLQVAPIVAADDRLVTGLVVITDVTEERERDRTNAARAEVQAVLERALEDRTGLVEFLEEAGALVRGVADERWSSLGEVKRAVHTVKGNCALFGLASVATYCHELETRMDEMKDLPTPTDRRELAARWRSATSSLERLFTKTSRDVLEVGRDEVDELVASVASGAPRVEIGRRLRLLRLEPLAQRFARVGEGATALAQRLGKEIEVEVRAGALRFDAALWAPFWAAFTHVVRNALDHGIEPPTDREAQGKSRAGRLVLDGRVDGDSFVLRASDDGRGVDWRRIADTAASRGMPSETRADLEAALFVDGVSSKQEVTDVSGRGVGLGAVRVACAALRGRIVVESAPGEGTTFAFAFPVESLGDAYTRLCSAVA